MYISTDSARTAGYTNSSSLAVSYTTITLKEGYYDLAFDWMAMGYVAESEDKNNPTDPGEVALYVCWVPELNEFGESINITAQANNALPKYVQDYALSFDDVNYLCGNAQWRTQVTRIYADGTPMRLVFAWRSSVYVPSNPGACIDNIKILDSRACPTPKNFSLSIQGEDVVLTWNKDTIQCDYEVKYYSYEEKDWHSSIISDTTITLKNVPEGFCDFYVRSVCEEDLTSIAATISEFIYFPEKRCIDYLTLTDENCYYSDKNAFTYTTDKINYHMGKIDDGYSSKTSCHTLHYVRTETDPRTGGQLKTVPDGEIASVRLGNWDTNAHSERIEFPFVVDTTKNPVLLMKYAVVLQNPGHDVDKETKQDPRFTLKVLLNGHSIGDCAEADFTSSEAIGGWKIYKPVSGTMVVWRDWTTVGVNLSKYHGQTLTIQLTTYDCGAGGHYGYAYFTLGCGSDQLDGLNCDGQPSTDFYAPEGFDYRWYLADDPLKMTLSTEQHFTIDKMDTLRYAVDVIFSGGGKDCYFTLYASSQPRYPVADFSYQYKPQDCKNNVVFTNKSRVETINQVTGDTTYSKCDYWEWIIQGQHYVNRQPPVITFPTEGGTFPVQLIVGVADCVAEKEIDIILPAIGTTYADNFMIGCTGYPYTYTGTNPDGSEFVGKTYYESGDYNDTIISSIGCDSIIVTHLLMQDTLFSMLDTIIMSDRPLMFNDTLRSKSGTYVHATKSMLGCDSVSTLKLYVHEYLIVDMPSVDSICATDNIWSVPFAIKQGRGYKYSVFWQTDNMEEILEQPVPRSLIDVGVHQPIRPDIYPAMIIFHDSMRVHYPEAISDDTLHVTLKVLYPDTVLAQRWNDVLAVRNMEHNGGFELVKYQWYKNGLPIDGATDSYYYVPDGLDMAAEYSALVTRAGDSLQLMTCPIVPTLISREFDIRGRLRPS